MNIYRFEDIVAWQKARSLTFSIYNKFKANRDFEFRDQIQSASISIMNNIAEGYERYGMKEFKHFLNISKGSSGEVKSMLYVALDLEYITKEDFEFLQNNVKEVSRLLVGLINSI